MHTDEFVLEVRDLDVTYGSAAGPTVRGVSFTLRPGEKLALVGGSGSGKSTTIASILGLLPGEGRITGGSITYRGTELVNASPTRWRDVRGKRIALVPQDPMSNLNPTMRVGDHIADALRAYGMKDKKAIEREVVQLMAESGIPDPERRAKQYPHEFSGGMRQRILIAIALAGDPDLVIADEPTSALDVTVQKHILDHLESLVEERGMSLLFVTHDLGVAADRTDTVLVMSKGEIVERGAPGQVLANPQHPYTRELVDASPTLEGTKKSASACEGGEGASSENVLEVEKVTKVFRLRGARKGEVRAVDDVSFTVRRGSEARRALSRERERTAAQGTAPLHAARVPGPVLVAQSDVDGRTDRARAPRHIRSRAQDRAPCACARGSRSRCTTVECRPRASRAALGRSASTRCNRPRTGGASPTPRVR